MKDEAIIALYWQREEGAISATAQKYGGYCSAIARHILPLQEDVEECVSDTWLRAWNSIPPHKPSRLSLFLGKITRELAINRYKASAAQKRGGGEYTIALEELAELDVAGDNTVEREVELKLLGGAISAFLRDQPALQRNIFIRRYYHLCSIKEIAAAYSISESKVKSILFRQRKKLRASLESEDLL